MARGRREPQVVAVAALVGTAVVVLVAVTLVGGVPALASGAVLLVVLGLAAGRWVLGADAIDGDQRRRARLAVSREPTLRAWDAALHDARTTPDGYGLHLYPMLLRLYEVRLAERHGVSLRTERARAAELIGPDLWPWIDPRSPRTPLDRRRAAEAADAAAAAGRAARPVSRQPQEPIPDDTLEALVTRLETL